MQTYYGRVIRKTVKADISDDEKITQMQTGIKAILYHRASSSAKPQHQYCPPPPASDRGADGKEI